MPGGLLGADYSVENGRYRFKKVYGGLNWNPDLQSSLTAPGVSVVAGEYLLAVQGQDLRPPANIYSFFENTAGKLIEITVGPNADGSGSRTVSVVPIANESGLRNRDWVEGNLVIGKRTWGGLVGTLGFPVLMDGGSVTAPNLAIWTEDGWVVENEGVPPDIEVEQTPADVIQGRDPQLEKAIEEVMDQLKKNPARAGEAPASSGQS